MSDNQHVPTEQAIDPLMRAAAVAGQGLGQFGAGSMTSAPPAPPRPPGTLDSLCALEATVTGLFPAIESLTQRLESIRRSYPQSACGLQAEREESSGSNLTDRIQTLANQVSQAVSLIMELEGSVDL